MNVILSATIRFFSTVYNINGTTLACSLMTSSITIII